MTRWESDLNTGGILALWFQHTGEIYFPHHGMREPTAMTTVNCFYCNQKIKLDGSPEIKQMVVCPNCGGAMEISWLFPLEIIPGGIAGDSPSLKEEHDRMNPTYQN